MTSSGIGILTQNRNSEPSTRRYEMNAVARRSASGDRAHAQRQQADNGWRAFPSATKQRETARQSNPRAIHRTWKRSTGSSPPAEARTPTACGLALVGVPGPHSSRRSDCRARGNERDPRRGRHQAAHHDAIVAAAAPRRHSDASQRAAHPETPGARAPVAVSPPHRHSNRANFSGAPADPTAAPRRHSDASRRAVHPQNSLANLGAPWRLGDESAQSLAPRRLRYTAAKRAR